MFLLLITGVSFGCILHMCDMLTHTCWRPSPQVRRSVAESWAVTLEQRIPSAPAETGRFLVDMLLLETGNASRGGQGSPPCSDLGLSLPPLLHHPAHHITAPGFPGSTLLPVPSLHRCPHLPTRRVALFIHRLVLLILLRSFPALQPASSCPVCSWTSCPHLHVSLAHQHDVPICPPQATR